MTGLMLRVRFCVIALLLSLAFAGCGASQIRARYVSAHGTSRSPGSLGCGAQSATLTSMAFPTAADGWVLAARNSSPGPASGSEILTTRNAGSSWSCQWRGALTPVQVLAVDPEHAWMLAWRGSGCGDMAAFARCASVVLGTRNGSNWSMLGRLSEGVTQLAFASPELGLAAARARTCREPRGLPPARCAGQVLRTTDGGRHWQAVLRTADPIVAVSAAHGTFWAVETRLGAGANFGHQPGLTVLVSHDGGRSWRVEGNIDLWLAGLRQRVNVLAGPRGSLWLSVFELDGCAMHGCSPDDLWQSKNGGRTWTLSDPVDRADGVPGAGCGVSGQIAIALQAGSAWAADGPPQATCERPAATLFHLAASSPRSSARGWVAVHRWASFWPGALAWPSRSTGYALGFSGLARSTDAGRSWTQVLPAAAPAANLDATGPLAAYGAQDATDQGAVLSTVTGGAAWRASGDLPIDVTAVRFISSRTGFAAGAAWLPAQDRPSWRLYATSNAGRSWRLRSAPPLDAGQQVSGLWMTASGLGLMLVSSGYTWPQVSSGVAPLALWQTHDGGRTWTRLRTVPLPSLQLLDGASFIRSGGSWHGWLFGSTGLKATTDSGRTWHSLPGAPRLNGVDFVNANFGVGWRGPHNGRIELWRTADGGHHWHRLSAPPALATGFNSPLLPISASFVTPQVGWLLANGATWRTTNAGHTWHQAGSVPFGL